MINFCYYGQNKQLTTYMYNRKFTFKGINLNILLELFIKFQQ